MSVSFDMLFMERMKGYIISEECPPHAKAIYENSKVYTELNGLDLVIIEKLLQIQYMQNYSEETILLDLGTLCDLVIGAHTFCWEFSTEECFEIRRFENKR